MAESTRDQARAARRTLIHMSLRKQRPGSGSQLNMPKRGFNLQWPDLREVLLGLRWSIVGAVAAREYMRERMTSDLDIAVLSADAEAAHERLDDAGFVLVAPLAIPGTSWRSPDGVAVDVLEVNESWWPEAFRASVENPDERGSPILPLPYLVLMKITSGRYKDSNDLSEMLGQGTPESLAEVRAIVRQFAPAELEDVESLISLGKLEFGSQ